MIDAAGVADAFALGTPQREPVAISGGLLNRMWRLDTDRGSFAVKELNLDRGWATRFDDVLRVELAAFAAGIAMPEPVPVGGHAVAEICGASVLVHRWVDASRIPIEPVTPAFASRVGTSLALMHSLDVEWTHVSIEDPMPTEEHWTLLADRAGSAGLAWAQDLAGAAPALGAIGRFVDAASDADETIVVTHRDVSQKNLLDDDGTPVVLDWETTGRMAVSRELGSTALNLAKGRDLNSLRPDVFHAVVDGYIDAGGHAPRPGPHWFVDFFSGWTWFIGWNVERCLGDRDLTAGQDLAVADDVIRNGLHTLPQAFARLDGLATLTLP